jgi:hypothetical protein
MAAVVAAAGGAGRYLHWGVVQISVTNAVIILVMLALFVLAILLPFPGHRDETPEQRP